MLNKRKWQHFEHNGVNSLLMIGRLVRPILLERQLDDTDNIIRDALLQISRKTSNHRYNYMPENGGLVKKKERL